MKLLIVLLGVTSVIILLLLRKIIRGGNYGLIARNIVKSYNVFRNYYKKGEKAEISTVLEISSVFSQIIYFKSGQFQIHTIRDMIMECKSISDREEEILLEFVKRIMVNIFILDTRTKPDIIYEAVNSKHPLIYKIINDNLGQVGGNKSMYRRTLRFVYNNPRCWSGIYNDF